MAVPTRLGSVKVAFLLVLTACAAAACSAPGPGGAFGAAPAVRAQAAAPPRTLYVSPNGNDANPGTSPGRPFRHIQRCAEVMGPGDTCDILSGTYRETVTPTRSGTAAAPIVYRAAPGARVTVDGAGPVGGWYRVTPAQLRALEAGDPFLRGSAFAQAVGAGRIEAARVLLNPRLPADQVFWRGRALVRAQWPWPGTDPLAPRVEYAAPGTSGAAVVDPALRQPPGYWDGARVTLNYDFVTETGTVVRSSPGRLSLAGLPHPGCAGGVAPYARYTRYSLSGKLQALGHAGEWFYDRSGRTLYLWPPAGAAPQHGGVEAKQRTLAFDLSHASYTRIVGLHLFAASVTTGRGTRGDVLDGIAARYVSAFDRASVPAAVAARSPCAVLSAGALDTGLLIQGADSAVRDSSVTFSAGDGIALTGSHDAATGDVVRDADTMGTYAGGVVLAGFADRASRDTIRDVGRSGIQIYTPSQGAAGTVVSHDDVGGFARLNVDTGAVYTCCGRDLAGARFDHNRLHGAAPLPGAMPRPLAGIYLDNGSNHALVYANVGWGLAETVLINDYSRRGLGPSAGDVVAYNDGGVALTVSSAPGTLVADNIGPLRVPPRSGATVERNLPPAIDPRYVDPAAHDYRLRADSPARGTGVRVPGVPQLFQGDRPSIGAYPYGAVAWRAGAP